MDILKNDRFEYCQHIDINIKYILYKDNNIYITASLREPDSAVDAGLMAWILENNLPNDEI